MIHSTTVRKKTIEETAQSKEHDARIIFQCSKLLRRAIEQSDKWKFNGSLSGVYEGTPYELELLIKWIIQGHKTVKTGVRAQNISRTSSHIAQQIVQAHKSSRQVSYQPKSASATFRSSTETPLTVGMSLYTYHHTRSKKMVDLVSHAGTGVSYNHTMQRINQIACGVQKNTEDHGVYIPPTLLQNRPFIAAIDNIDAKVDTPDGKDSFHALAGAIFQEGCMPGEAVEYATEPVQLDQKIDTTLKDVPKTGVELLECPVTGCPKPKSSPHYPQFKQFQHQDILTDASKHDMVWLLVRHYGRSTREDQTININESTADGNEVSTDELEVQSVPVWAAYNSILTSATPNDRTLDEVHALPLINAPAHEWADHW